MVNIMRMTERQLGGWSLLAGTATVAVGFVLSPGRGAVDNVAFVNLNDITLAMGRNETLAYATNIVIILGALLMLHGLLTLRRYAAPVPRLGLLAMSLALVLQLVMRGLDYMIAGMGGAALESDAAKSQEWLDAALATQRVWFGLHLASGVAGFTGTAVLALGLAYRPEPVRLPRALNAIVAALAVASLVVFIATWHSNDLELAFAPVFAAMSVSGLVYMVLLGRGLASSKDDEPGQPEAP
ncbi:MAG: hypothetical protein OXK21_04370 [Chloroflexota bacterium]|nr:hypothetical protein [Chloroflexota bacterium]